jgi:hypothetical protein
VSLNKLVFLVVFAIVAVLGFDGLEYAGLIPHRQLTATYIGQNGWMTGEYRECIAVPTKTGNLAPFEGVMGGFLSCDLEGHERENLDQVTAHEMDVTYWGRKNRPDLAEGKQYSRELRRRNALCAKTAITAREKDQRQDLCDEDKHIGKIEWHWRCRRNVASLTCWAEN